MNRTWKLRDIDEPASAKLARELNVHAATARCLVARGVVDAGRAGAHLNPRLADLRPPTGMAGFRAATDRLLAAIRGGETIGVFGDYDVDGVTSAALLSLFLKSVGARVVTKVAERDAGYGFGVAQALWFCDRGCQLIVTLDCGTSDLPAILAARARQVDVVVVDHHQVPDGTEHPAKALVNPHHPDSTYAYRGLASVGLAFFLAAALRTALRQEGWFASRNEPDVRLLLDLVAVGTIADLAPLTDENRILVALGLRELSLRRRPGLAALLRAAAVPDDRGLDEIDVGWRIGPRLNAPGRLGDAAPSLALLMAGDESEAARCVAVCEDANSRRRLLQEQMLIEALEDAASATELAAVVVGRPGWHAGVAGIVAAKLVDRFGKPAIVLAIDPLTGEARGSVRSARGVDVYRALCACSEHLVRYGGHAMAAGLTIDGARIPALREDFARQAAQAVPVAPGVDVDVALRLGEVDDRLADELRRLAPFGQGNQAPVIAAVGARVTSSRRVGEDGSHLKLTLACERDATAHAAIAFRMGELDPGVGAAIDIAFRPEVSVFRGVRRLELHVSALRLAGQALS